MMHFRNISKYEAVCYYWIDVVTNKIVYVGFHKTNEVNSDNYVSSSTNPAFKSAWAKGQLRRVVFFHGSIAQCISLEHYMLDRMNAKKCPAMFNASNGGGAGCDLSLVTDEMKQLVENCVAGKFKETIPNHSYSENLAFAEDMCERIKSGQYYIPAETYVGELAGCTRVQIREVRKLNHHINQLVERMHNPALARAHIKPVVVVVKSNTERYIIDGNHTLDAATKAGWPTIPAIFINSSEFEDSMDRMKLVGRIMNRKPDLKQGNSKEDIRRAIYNIHEETGLPLWTEEFKQIIYSLYEPEGYTRKSLLGLIIDAEKKKNTQARNSAYNFYVYSKDEMKAHVQKFWKQHPYEGCIAQASSEAYMGGIGGIVNSLRQRNKGRGKSYMKNPKGTIFIYHKNVDDYENRNQLHSDLVECLQIAGIDKWVNIEYMPCFIDTNTNELIFEPK